MVKSFLHKTLKKNKFIEKEIFFKNKEINFLFEELLDELAETERAKDDYRSFSDDAKMDLMWNHKKNIDKIKFTFINIDYKSKNLIKHLNKLDQWLSRSCICLIKRFESFNGLNKLVNALIEALKEKCRDKEKIVALLKCFKSFGNNRYGTTRLFEHESLCQIFCQIIVISNSSEVSMVLDLLSIMCLINRDACNKIIACFTMINNTSYKNRLKPLIVCAMNTNEITVQQSVIQFINTLLHSSELDSDHSVQFRLRLRNELYELGFEDFLKLGTSAPNEIVAHHIDIFLNKKAEDKEKANIELVNLKNEFSTMDLCTKELKHLLNQKYCNKSLGLDLLQTIIYLIKFDDTSLEEVIQNLNRRLLSSVLSDSDSHNVDNDEDYYQSSQKMNLLNKNDIKESYTNDENRSLVSIFDEDYSSICDSMSNCSDAVLKLHTSGGSQISLNIAPNTLAKSDLNQLTSKGDHFTLTNDDDVSNTVSVLNSASQHITSFSNTSTSNHSSSQKLSQTQSIQIATDATSSSFSSFSSQQSELHISRTNDYLLSPTKNTASISPSNIPRSTVCSVSADISLSKGLLSQPLQEVDYPSLSPSLPLNTQLITPLAPPPPPNASLPPPPPPPGAFLPPPAPPPGAFLPPPAPPPPSQSLIRPPSASITSSNIFGRSSKPTYPSLRKINVTPVSEKAIVESSVWFNVPKTPVSENTFKKIVELYSSNTNIKEVKTKFVKKLIVLSDKEANNFEIFLRSMPMSIEELIKSIKEMNINIISMDMISKILHCMPNEDNLKRLLPYKEKYEELRICEQFLVLSMTVDSFIPLLNILQLQIMIANKWLGSVEDMLSLINDTFEQLLDSVNIKSILETVLLLTNAMNSSQNLVGITIESLTKLADTKDNQNGNFLQFIIEHLQECNPDAVNVWNDLPHLSAVLTSSNENMTATILQFSDCLQSAEKNLDNFKSTTLHEELVKNVQTARHLLQTVLERHELVHRNYIRVKSYFSITNQNYSFENLFQDLNSFKNQFNHALNQISVKKAIEKVNQQKFENEKERQRKHQEKSNMLASKLLTNNLTAINYSDELMIGISSGQAFFTENSAINLNLKRSRKPRILNRINHGDRHTPNRTRKIIFSSPSHARE